MVGTRPSGLSLAVAAVLCAGRLIASASHHHLELERARRQLTEAQAKLAEAQAQLAVTSALETGAEAERAGEQRSDQLSQLAQDNRRSAAGVRKLTELIAAGQQSPPQQNDDQPSKPAGEKAKPITSLHKAAAADRWRDMRRFVELRGVLVDGVDERGRTALHVAAYEGKVVRAR